MKGDREMSWWLGAVSPLPEDAHSISQHPWLHTILCNSRPQGIWYNALLSTGTAMVYRHKHWDKKSNTKYEKKENLKKIY